MQNKLNTWKKSNLSQGGKEVLIKTVALSISTYGMSYFKLSDSLCRDLEGMMACYWWGQKGEECNIYQLSQEKMYEPKSQEGLGFKNLKYFNLTLLAKQGQKVNQNEECLLHRVYMSHFFPQTNFCKAKLDSNSSYAWRGIWEAKKVFLNGKKW